MLKHHCKPVCLSLISTDLPVWSAIEAAATLYQKDRDRFHLLLSEPLTQGTAFAEKGETAAKTQPETPRLLWLEISPYRAVMTMQHNNRLSYRHLWEQGVYGLSRYWMREDLQGWSGQLRLRNFTRSLELVGHPFPKKLRIEYELWTEKLRMGHYVLNLEIRD